MKLTRERLKQIIKEELEEIRYGDRRGEEPIPRSWRLSSAPTEKDTSSEAKKELDKHKEEIRTFVDKIMTDDNFARNIFTNLNNEQKKDQDGRILTDLERWKNILQSEYGSYLSGITSLNFPILINSFTKSKETIQSPTSVQERKKR